MKNFLGLLVLVLFGASATSHATVFVGNLKIQKVMCVRAPCPPLVSFTSGALKPFAVKAAKGTAAEAFLNLIVVTGHEANMSVTIEGQIERENLIVATDIVRTENEPPARNPKAVNMTGFLDAEKVLCNRAPCPAPATLVNDKGVRYVVTSEDNSAAERFLDKLNSSIMGNTVRVKVRVIGEYVGRSMIIRAAKIEVIK